MTVYIDNMRRRARVGRINGVWSHLFADTHEELMEFAQRLGLKPEWLQHAGTYREHFDVTESNAVPALQLGAVPINYPRGTAELLARKRRETLQ